MMLSRAKAAHEADDPSAAGSSSLNKSKQVPTLDHFLESRDYTGAITLLEFQKNANANSKDKEKKDLTDLWIAFCAFHLGDYERARKEYETLTKQKKCDEMVWCFLACCYFFLGMYKQAQEAAKKGPKCGLQNRLLFHISHKDQDEKQLMKHHQQLHNVVEDQLCLASIHYMRGHYQEAIDIYKRILLENRDYVALNVYIAMCYYKLDYYDVSQEVLSIYLQQHPDSAIAVNLKACNHFRLYNGKAAEMELKKVEEMSSAQFEFASELARHNLCVFRGGENALPVLRPLRGLIPEATLNLVIYHLKQDEFVEAYNLMKDLEPSTPHEYILKGVVNASLAQLNDSAEHRKIAQQYFQLVGGSASECDTIPGRQCMASCFFLLENFKDVLVYLESIKSYFYSDDRFMFNFAQAKAAVGEYVEAEEAFLLIQSHKIRSEYTYLSWLARCYIYNKKARLAYELYLKMDTSAESFALLQLIANDCYRVGSFVYSAKAFDVLERLDANPEYFEGKRGACVGVFQQVIAGKEPKESLSEVLSILRNSTQNAQMDSILRVIRKWAKENGVAH